jgi:YcaO-like protein with predicted kinase domain
MTSAEDCEATLAWLGERIGAMGISRLANITGLDVIGLPVFVAVRPASRSLSVAQGKGQTVCEAKVSALMEAAESFHAERVEQPLLLASQSEFGQSSAFVELAQFPAAEGYCPQATQQILWVRGWEIISEQQMWVPYDLVSTAYTVEMTENYSGLYATTTGLAAGVSVSDAIDHGLREVVERDATLLHLLSGQNSRNRRRIRLNSISKPGAIALLQRFRSNGIFVAIWEVTSDIEIPCFFCVIAAEPNQYGEHNFFAGGAGCDPDKDRALIAALTEAAQSRLTTISGAREDLDLDRYNLQLNTEFLAEYDALRSSEGDHTFAAIVSYGGLTLEGRLQLMADKLSAKGLKQIIVVNLTNEEINIPVVKIIVPGMEVALEAVGSIPGTSMTRRTALK